MYADRPHHDEPTGQSGRSYGLDDAGTVEGAERSLPASVRSTAGQLAGAQPTVDVAVALQRMPYADMVTFSLSLARDLLQRDDPAAVSRVAEALIATAQVWHPAE